MKFLIFIFVISMESVLNCQEIKPLELINLDNNYRIIDDIIKNPDTLNYYLNQYRLIKKYSLLDSGSFVIISKILKDNFNSNFRYIYCQLIIQMYDSNFYKMWNIIKFEAQNTVQIASLRTGKRMTFTFEKNFNVWALENVDVLNPHEHIDPSLYQKIIEEKGIIPTLDSSDNCKLYIEDNYKAISKLLNNSDSLYNFLLKIYPKNQIKNDYINSNAFSDFVKNYKNGYVINVDELFEADGKFKLEIITLINKIRIKTNYSTMDGLSFYFMKKGGVWQFYDIKLE